MRGPAGGGLIDGVLEWAAGQPPSRLYLLLAAFAFLENLVPPLPADTGIAFGAFLAARQLASPWAVFAATWLGNVAGIIVVFVLVRRLGPALLARPLVARLLPARALEAVRRDYARFGAAGLFLARLVPGLRAATPAVAALAGLPAALAVAPLALASALWYAAVVAAGMWVGREWAQVQALLVDLNRGFLIAGAALLAALAAAWWSRGRRG
ncbi:MAG: VTT domain-containing protein [Gemmatimonadales bacterium]|nr:VTT domain-containing protein [Gemmatimonadales bacterium]